MNISNTELKVMMVLWQESPLTVGQIVTRLQPDTGWHESTIKTLMTRLLNKAAISRKKDGRQFFYQPLVDKDAVITDVSESLLKRFFGGKLAPLVSHFAANKQISQTDLAEIERILSELKDHD